MARLLTGGGYDTAALVGAFGLDHQFGLGQGFDTDAIRFRATPTRPAASKRLDRKIVASLFLS